MSKSLTIQDLLESTSRVRRDKYLSSMFKNETGQFEGIKKVKIQIEGISEEEVLQP